MTTQLDSEIALLQKKVEAARVQKARSEAILEKAQEDRAKILKELSAEFGLDNLQGARVKLAELQDELTRKVADINHILSKF